MEISHLFTFLLILNLLILTSTQNRSRFRRRELVEEHVRKTMNRYMTSLKGEIADVILDELNDFYAQQKFKIDQLEKDFDTLRKSNNQTNNLLVEQSILMKNLSTIESQLKNLSKTFKLIINQEETSKFPIDCDEIRRNNKSENLDHGVFRIQPRFSSYSFDVLCFFENQTGWIVLQQRSNGSLNFYRTWYEYKTGFGNLTEEFWLGNEQIHQITQQEKYHLRIDLEPWQSSSCQAYYGKFAVADEKQNYRLEIADFDSNQSTVGDSLTPFWDNANGASFSTFDRDNDQLFYDNCALIYQSAWWFTSCFQSHLNGVYIRPPLALENRARNGLQWNTYDLYHSMRATKMLIRRST